MAYEAVNDNDYTFKWDHAYFKAQNPFCNLRQVGGVEKGYRLRAHEGQQADGELNAQHCTPSKLTLNP